MYKHHPPETCQAGIKNLVAPGRPDARLATPMEKKFDFSGTHAAEKLVERAVRNAKPMRGTAWRWIVVANTFGCTPATAKGLCRHFGMNPDDGVARA